MPFAGNLGNHLNLGVAKLCEAVTSGGVLYDHGLGAIPAAVIIIPLGATAAKVSYDRDNSTVDQMKLYTDDAGGIDCIAIPISGTEVGA